MPCKKPSQTRIQKLASKEKKEHPWLTVKEAYRVAKDHLSKKVKKK